MMARVWSFTASLSMVRFWSVALAGFGASARGLKVSEGGSTGWTGIDPRGDRDAMADALNEGPIEARRYRYRPPRPKNRRHEKRQAGKRETASGSAFADLRHLLRRSPP